ncbi:MAG: PatB family C-S lyase [Candidatus Cloacimonetes bacterium]|jgi:cystathionine beta-lyase|nr:PatB family C-S lyase [Candidatus Cloacimonadota bacterium]
MSRFDRIIDRKNTKCYKWDYNKEIFGKEDLLSMWVADTDFQAPQEVLEILRKRVDHGIFGYTGLTDSFYTSIINWMKNRFDWNIKKDWIVTTPGIVPAINFAVQTYTKKYDKILVQTPVYYPFFTSIENNDRELIISELKLLKDHYAMDFEDLETKFADNIKMMILCSPHNPVSRVWKLGELQQLSELCLKYNVLLLSDEIHSDLILNGNKHIPIPTISKKIANNSLTMFAPSKTFNVAGLSLSFVIIPNKNIRVKFQKTLLNLGLHGGNVFGIEALEASYRYGQKWLDELLIYIENNYTFVQQYLQNNIPKIKALPMEGTYLLWLDCRGMDLTQKELVKFFINKAGLALNDGTKFGKGGEGFMRMNLGCPRKLIMQALNQLEIAVNSS